MSQLAEVESVGWGVHLSYLAELCHWPAQLPYTVAGLPASWLCEPAGVVRV